MISPKLENQENRILGLPTLKFQNNDIELLECNSGERGILAPG